MGNNQPKKTLREIARENKRTVDRASRHVDRERTKIQNQEPKLLKEIKQMATKNQHVRMRTISRSRIYTVFPFIMNLQKAAKILTKDLVRIRHQVSQYYAMSSQLKALSMQLTVIEGNQSMLEAMKGATSTMEAVNKNMDVKSIQKLLKDFAKENQKMELQGEMVLLILLTLFSKMSDAIDMGLDDAEMEDETDQIYGQVCEELGLEYNENDQKAREGKIEAAENKKEAVRSFEVMNLLLG